MRQAGIAYADDKCIDSQLLVASLVALFRQRGLSIDNLLAGSAIFEQDLNQPQHKISATQLQKLLSNAIKYWPGDDLAFILGQQWLPAQSGPLTQGLLCCNDFAQAQSFWQRYHWLVQPWLQISLWQTAQQQHLLIQQAMGMPHLQRFFIELTLSSLVSSFKYLTRSRWHSQFLLPYPQPDNIDQYHKYLGGSLSFNQPICVLSIDHSLRYQPFEMANPQGLTQANRNLRHSYFNRHYRISLPAMVRQLLLKQQQIDASLPHIAEQLSLSPATLKRRLKAFNISFQQLQDEAKLQQAIYMIAVHGDNNLNIAKQLRFADSNNFRRSFKRWTGKLPSNFKYWLTN
ncbi:AraC family transcriptional regulator ligand-binding domain-containing protein [Shewanella waksmanii]|uniref:AraC family transcriptional regulator n=1 Tax=Shewanella waksmanii TaxID=213783 RepID=UPI003734FCAF